MDVGPGSSSHKVPPRPPTFARCKSPREWLSQLGRHFLGDKWEQRGRCNNGHQKRAESREASHTVSFKVSIILPGANSFLIGYFIVIKGSQGLVMQSFFMHHSLLLNSILFFSNGKRTESKSCIIYPISSEACAHQCHEVSWVLVPFSNNTEKQTWNSALEVKDLSIVGQERQRKPQVGLLDKGLKSHSSTCLIRFTNSIFLWFRMRSLWVP